MTTPIKLEPRRGRIALAVALAATLALLCCGGGGTVLFLGLFDDNSSSEFSFGCGSADLIDLTERVPRIGVYGEEQIRNAAIIISVGQQLKVPPRGWVIAVATAMQESSLRNLGNLGSKNDHDSLGLFQQRPSQGWGTPEQIMDPRYSSRKFYEKLLTIPDWDKLPLTEAAQRVQVSAFPDAYAKHETTATKIVNVLTDGAARAVGGLTELRCALAGEISASGWTVPLKGKIVSGFRTRERPTHHGVDLAASKGTVIHAASAGIVIKVKCDVPASWSCDRDGSPGIKGCGWYVDILHAGSYITRYCHQIKRPDVNVGQHVTAGQQIGLSGSSGNSSGPHLHFEVHRDGDRSSAGAISPDDFMRDMGAPLGDGTP